MNITAQITHVVSVKITIVVLKALVRAIKDDKDTDDPLILRHEQVGIVKEALSILRKRAGYLDI